MLPLWETLPVSSSDHEFARGKDVSLILSTLLAPHQSPEELFTVAQRGVGIYDGAEKSPLQGGVLALSSHRVFYVDTIERSSGASHIAIFSLPLRLVVADSVLHTSGFGAWSHPKISLVVREASGNNGEPREKLYKFSFRSGGSTTFLECLQQCLRRQMWNRTTLGAPSPGGGAPIGLNSSSSVNSATVSSSTGTPLYAGLGTGDGVSAPAGGARDAAATLLTFTDRAGIGGVQRTQHVDASNMDGLASRALSDVDSVLSHTHALALEIRKLRQQVSGGAESSGGDTRAEAVLSTEDLNKLVSVEEALGIRKRSHSTSSVMDLTEELLQWLCHPTNSAVLSQRCFVPLAEFFALYNNKAKGRSREYVPVEKFCQAAMLLEQRSVNLSRNLCFATRVFKCGVKALQCAPMATLVAMLVKYLGPQPATLRDVAGIRAGTRPKSVDASTLATWMQIDVGVAYELLEDLEVDEVLCRDESNPKSYSTVCRFSWNYFLLPS